MSTEVADPLSLEDMCFLYLICHLEDFPPETLALLPLHLRRKLLLNLPAADVKQLENTGVVASINMEDTVWRVGFAEHSFGFCFTHLGFTNSFNPFYDNIFLEVAKEILFSVRGCLGITNWDYVQHNLAFVRKESVGNSCVTPWRYMAQVSESFQYIDLLLFLVKKCQWFPVKLEIRCSDVVCSDLWKQRDKLANFVRKLLSEIQGLSLWLNRPHDEDIAPVAHFFLEQALSNSTVSLNHLTLNGIDSGDTAVAPAIAKFFYRASHTIDPVYHHPNIPYSGLASIDFYLEEGLAQRYLELMICYQNALKSVTVFCPVKQLFGWSFTPRLYPFEGLLLSSSLVSTLASLFHQPQFEQLTLRGVKLTWEHVSTLITPFLTAPTGDHEKVLYLWQYQFQSFSLSEALDVGDVCAGHSADRALQRSLILKEGNRCIPVHSCTNHLSSLTIGALKCLFLPVDIYLDKANTNLQYVHFCNVHFRFESVNTLRKSFSNLFQGSQLKTLHLDICFIGTNGLLPVLTDGLRQQVSVGSLENLSLKCNGLGTSWAADSELEKFFNVLFSLPQIPRLQLDLRANHLNSDHLYAMWDSCRRHQPIRQMKLLNITMQCHNLTHPTCCRDIPNHIRSILQRVATSGDFIMTYVDSDDSDDSLW